MRRARNVCLGAIVVWLAWTGRAEAGARALPSPGPAPIPALAVVGPATIEDLRIEVRCEGGGAAEVEARCRVRAGFVVRAGAAEIAIQARVPEHPYEGTWTDAEGQPLSERELLADGAPVSSPRTLAAGERAAITIDASRRFATSRELVEAPWIVAPMLARHFVLGETAASVERAATLHGAIVSGDAIRIAGTVEIDARDRGPARITLAGADVEERASVAADPAFRPDLACVLDVPPPHQGPFAHGGPALGLGDRIELQSGRERFLLRVAYELGIVEHLFATIEFETDFESILEAVVLEVSSPGLIVVVPSASAGIGVVARQLGQREADAALRLRLGMVLWVVGFAADFDYWPAIGEWSATVVARLSV